MAINVAINNVCIEESYKRERERESIKSINHVLFFHIFIIYIKYFKIIYIFT